MSPSKKLLPLKEKGPRAVARELERLLLREGAGYFWFKRYATNLENTYSTFYSILAEIACK